MSQDVSWSSLLSTSNSVHYLSFCLNHLQYLFICSMLGAWYFHHMPQYPHGLSVFQMPQVAEWSVCRVRLSLPYNTKIICHSKQMLSPYVSSSEGWGILAWGLFSCWKLLSSKQFSFLVLLHDNKIDNVNPCPLKIYWNPFSKIFRLGVIWHPKNLKIQGCQTGTLLWTAYSAGDALQSFCSVDVVSNSQPVSHLGQFLSASLYVSKRGAYWDRLCRDVVGRWLSRACTVAKRCILGL